VLKGAPPPHQVIQDRLLCAPAGCAANNGGSRPARHLAKRSDSALPPKPLAEGSAFAPAPAAVAPSTNRNLIPRRPFAAIPSRATRELVQLKSRHSVRASHMAPHWRGPAQQQLRRLSGTVEASPALRRSGSSGKRQRPRPALRRLQKLRSNGPRQFLRIVDPPRYSTCRLHHGRRRTACSRQRSVRCRLPSFRRTCSAART